MSVNEQLLGSDEETLHRLGYAQELRRRMSGFSNFAVSFTIISILSGCLTLYGYGMDHRRPGRHRLGLAVRRHHDPVRRPGHGRGLLQLPDRRRPVLLVGQAGQAQRPGLVLVHRLVQLPRPGGRHRRHRLRRRAVHQRPAEPAVRTSPRRTGSHDPDLRARAARARPAEPVRHQAGGDAQRRQRLVAHPRRADHRRRPGLRPVPSPVRQLRVRPPRERHRAARSAGGTSSRSACCSPSTPSPATTPQRT